MNFVLWPRLGRVASLMVALMFAAILLGPRPAWAQVDTATLSGTVADLDQALVPGATVTVTNRGNKFTRKTKTNGSGTFSFPSIAWGDYDLTVQMEGFSTLSVHSIHLNPGDNRSLPQLQLKVGAETMTVTVSAQSLVSVDDSGERSSLITSDEINKLTLQGRDVTELLKTLPGAAVNTGNASLSGNFSNSTADLTNTQIGGASNGYAMSGSPTNGVSIRSDGANITDPGTYSGTMQNINNEATAEVKVSQQNFGADTANGPIVINAVSKSGGVDFHGSLYVQGRTYQMNANDAFSKPFGYGRPPDRQIYSGATLGGPVKIPGTDFNHNKRLTFFIQAEDLAQRNEYAYGAAQNAIQTALVPTANMRKGDFSATEIAKYLPPGTTVCTASNTCPTDYTPYSNIREVPISDASGNAINCAGNTGNDCLSGAGAMDPGSLAIVNSFPLPNTPDGQTTAGAYNYSHINLVPNNLWTTHGKLEFKPSERHTLSLSFTQEFGNTVVPQSTDYYASGNSGGVLTPGYGTNRDTHTYSGAFNWTSTWSATLTNEFFVNGAYNDHIDAPRRPDLLFSSSIGFPYQGAYNNKSNEPPTLLDYGYNGLPLLITPDYSYGPLYSKTLVPSVGDNLTKVFGKHTVKVGFTVERPSVNNIQSNDGSYPTNGGIANYYIAPTFTLMNDPNNPSSALTTYHSTCYSGPDAYCSHYNGNSNALANFMTGSFGTYQQANQSPHLNMYAWNTSFYVNDDYKVTRTLTLNVGLRFDHLGRWTDAHGFGISVWRPDLYAGDPVNDPTRPLPGFRWNAIDKSTPIGGFPTRAFFYSPRAGLKWDPHGNGKTVFSGGWGMYRFHEPQSDFQNMLAVTNGLRSVNISNPGQYAGLRYSYISALGLSADPDNVSSTFSTIATGFPTTTTTVYGVKSDDDESPLTYTYSFTVTQQMPMDLNFSLGYAGNQSKDLLNDGSNQQIFADNINAIPVGGLFQANPNIQSKYYGITYPAANIPGIPNEELNDFRPYPHYSTLQVVQHSLYSNYNALQLVVSRYKGHVSFNAAYTFSKTMGVRGSYQTGIPGDSFNMRNNYGPLSYDRSHVLNVWYSFTEGDPYKGNRFVRGVLNGWELSGNTSLQSGQNLQATDYVSDFGLQGQINANAAAGLQAYQVTNKTYLGTPDVSLQPKLSCDPRSNLAPHQYINANCFVLPAQGGDNGPFIYPYITGPAYFDTDLTAVKNFKFSESKNLQFRLAGFNFVNHPLPTFTNKAPTQTELYFPTASNQDFGKITYFAGRRILEAVVKYTF